MHGTLVAVEERTTEAAMRVLTVRNVPDDLYEILVGLAARNRRSLQQQSLDLLERARLLDHVHYLERAASVRSRLQGRKLGDTVAEVREERTR